MSETRSEQNDLNEQIAQRLFGWERVNDPTTWAKWRTPEGHECWHPLDYTAFPPATAQVWQWLETQAWIGDICFPYHYDGKIKPRHVRCEIAYRTGRKGTVHGCATGTGATWPEALCRAALALAEALEQGEGL